GDALVVTDTDLRIIAANASAARLAGLPAADLTGASRVAIFGGDEAELKLLVSSGGVLNTVEERRIDGELRYYETRYLVIEFGDTNYLFSATRPVDHDREQLHRDIVRSEEKLRAQHERIRALYLAAAQNSANETQIGSTLELGCKLLGLELGAIYDSADGDALAHVVDLRPREADEPAAEIPARICRLAIATNGALALDSLDGIPFFGEPQPGESHIGAFVGAPIDVAGQRYGSLNFASVMPREEALEATDRDLVQLMTVLIGGAIERRRVRSHLRSLAYYDSLTGLPNRVLLLERLSEALNSDHAAEHPCAVLFLDLDRFKDSNDSLGHALGDRLLQLVGERILSCVRSADTVARMGGDEFVVLLHEPRDVAEVVAVTERLLHAVDGSFNVSGFEQYVTTSIGVAISPSDGQDAETLIKHADIAMYKAKERGRNTYALFTPELNAMVSARLSQEKGLRKALERNEFIVHYQPIINLRARRIYGLEALVRWNHPTLGLLGPDTFIPAAETSGLIVTLGEFVLRDSCAQVQRWHDEGFGDLRLAVNLSARQFHGTTLAATVQAALEDTNYPPGLLELEITESAAMADAGHSIDIMRDLRKLGTHIALDDFGTGYSSLSYLRRFPVEAVKIDRSFVGNITRDTDDKTIVRAVIGMAHSLGLAVVAEGVETSEQVEFLRREGCDRAQGYLFCAGRPASDIDRFLRSWSAVSQVG
ncbi:MAG TPA: EAL domain-containing protein, partial [Candidatus Baltobacteraceae bacterium]